VYHNKTTTKFATLSLKMITAARSQYHCTKQGEITLIARKDYNTI